MHTEVYHLFTDDSANFINIVATTVAELLPFEIVFTGEANTTSTPIGLRRGWGIVVSHKVAGRSMLTLKQPNGVHPLVPFSTPYVTV